WGRPVATARARVSWRNRRAQPSRPPGTRPNRSYPTSRPGWPTSADRAGVRVTLATTGPYIAHPWVVSYIDQHALCLAYSGHARVLELQLRPRLQPRPHTGCRPL